MRCSTTSTVRNSNATRSRSHIAAAQAYIADVTDPEDRAKGLGLLGAAFGLGFVFGPAAAGALYTGVAYWLPLVVGGLAFLPVVGLLGSVDGADVAPTAG